MHNLNKQKRKSKQKNIDECFGRLAERGKHMDKIKNVVIIKMD